MPYPGYKFTRLQEHLGLICVAHQVTQPLSSTLNSDEYRHRLRRQNLHRRRLRRRIFKVSAPTVVLNVKFLRQLISCSTWASIRSAFNAHSLRCRSKSRCHHLQLPALLDRSLVTEFKRFNCCFFQGFQIVCERWCSMVYSASGSLPSSSNSQ